MKGIIRRADLADIPHLVILKGELQKLHSEIDSVWKLKSDWESVFRTYFLNMFNRENTSIAVLQVDGSYAGYCIAIIKESPPFLESRQYGFINDIFVADDFRRRGFGSELLNEALEWFLSYDVKRVELNLAYGNTASRAFWSNQGFSTFVERKYIDLT